MAHLYCQVDDFQNHLGDGLLGHLWQTVFTRLAGVMPAHCGWHQALDSGPWLFNKKGESELIPGVLHSPPPDYNCSVTSHRLYPCSFPTMVAYTTSGSQNKPILPSVALASNIVSQEEEKQNTPRRWKDRGE